MSEVQLTQDKVAEKLKVLQPREIRYIDPMRMPHWSLDTACAMVDDAVSQKTLNRAIGEGSLKAYKAGKQVTVTPSDFIDWYESFQK